MNGADATRRLLGGLLAIAALAAVLVAPARPVVPPERRLCMTLLDVGQGDAQLLSLGSQRWLVDGGGVRGGVPDVGLLRVLPALRRAGVDRLDRVLVTHGDADHLEGLFAVLDQMPVGELWIPSRKRLSPRLGALVELARRRGTPVRVADDGDAFAPAPAPVRAQLLHPWPGWDRGESDEARSSNNRSLVLRLQVGDVSMLMTGDLEVEGEARLLRAGVLGPATVLKVGHHGSRTSSTPAFVEAVQPAVALAGAARDNRYGFPHASVRRRFATRGVPFFWTGAHGDLRACTDGFGLEVDRWEGRRWEPLRSLSASDIAAWGTASGPAPAPTGASPPAAEGGPKPVRRAKREARRPTEEGGRAGRAGAKDAPGAPPRSPAAARRSKPAAGKQEQGAPPDLAPDSGWRRERKARQRLKAPWRSR